MMGPFTSACLAVLWMFNAMLTLLGSMAAEMKIWMVPIHLLLVAVYLRQVYTATKELRRLAA